MAFIPSACRSLAADAVCAQANGGKLVIYSGVAPVDADAALSGNTVLAELDMSATAFGAAVAGLATANAVASDTSANATGTATFFRVLKSDGTTVVFQGTVGTSGAELNMTSTAIVAGVTVAVSSLTYTQAKT